MWVGQSKGVTDLEPGWGKLNIDDLAIIVLMNHLIYHLPSTIVRLLPPCELIDIHTYSILETIYQRSIAPLPSITSLPSPLELVETYCVTSRLHTPIDNRQLQSPSRDTLKDSELAIAVSPAPRDLKVTHTR
jgi:hypothetical protein